MNKVFVFDIGNVLWFYQKPLQTVFKEFSKLTNLKYKHFYSKYLLIYKDFETGTANLLEWLNQINKSNQPISQAQINKILKTYLSLKIINQYYNRPVLNLIKRLTTQGYKVGMLSNAEYYLIPYIHKRMHKFFDFSIVSGHVGFRKPDPIIYQQIFKCVNCSPNQVIFIDDKKENLDSAKALSINTLIYSDHQVFMKKIKSLL